MTAEELKQAVKDYCDEQQMDWRYASVVVNVGDGVTPEMLLVSRPPDDDDDDGDDDDADDSEFGKLRARCLPSRN